MREICDLCRSKPAKNHLCEIIDGEQTSLDLCDDCLRARGAPYDVQLPVLDGTQRCYYCDKPAEGGGRNLPWEESVRGQPFHFVCRRCAKLYHDFLTASLASIPDDTSASKGVDAIKSLVAECDKKVREAV